MPFNVAPGYCLINPNDRLPDVPEGIGYGKVIEIPTGAVFPVVDTFVMYKISDVAVRPGANLRLYVPIGDIIAVKV